jgi:hypothetical protein
VVDFHGAVVGRAEDCDHRDFPGSHLAETFQILITLLHIHIILRLGSGDQLEVGEDKQILIHTLAHTESKPRDDFKQRVTEIQIVLLGT